MFRIYWNLWCFRAFFAGKSLNGWVLRLKNVGWLIFSQDFNSDLSV